MDKSILNNPSNIYFIYADDEYERYYNFDTFRAILNFHALFYDRVVVPDSFFINNSHLVELLKPEKRKSYVEQGIVSPCSRSGIRSLSQIHQQFQEKKIIRPSIHHHLTKDYFDRINLKKGVTWELQTSSATFSSNLSELIESNSDELGLTVDEKNRLLEQMAPYVQSGTLNRTHVRKLTDASRFSRIETATNIKNMTNLIYNFNLPQTLGITAAYPEKLQNVYDKFSSPRALMFQDQVPSRISSELKETDHTLLFDFGILSKLDVEQVATIRSSAQFKRFIQAVKSNDATQPELLMQSFLAYNRAVTHDILPEIMPKADYEEKRKASRKIEVTQKVYEAGKETLSFSLGLFLPPMASVLVTALFKGTDYMMQKKNQASQNAELQDQRKMRGDEEIRNSMTGENVLGKIKSLSTTFSGD